MSDITQIPIQGYVSQIVPHSFCWNNTMAIQSISLALANDVEYETLLKIGSIIANRQNADNSMENITYSALQGRKGII